MKTNEKSIGSNVLYPELSYEIVGALFEVHSTLGCGFLEKVYENALICELKRRGITCNQQVALQVGYKGNIVGEYVADVIVDGKVLIELKVVRKLENIHRAQVMNYLKATGLRLGLLVNFANPKLDCERIAF